MYIKFELKMQVLEKIKKSGLDETTRKQVAVLLGRINNTDGWEH